MANALYLFLFGVAFGLVGVASNPSPYFAALGLMWVAGMGCGVLIGYGGCFLSLVLFLIYLGGMLVVFAYSAALAAEPYPETWGNRWVLVAVVVYMVGLVTASSLVWDNWYESSWLTVNEQVEFSMASADTEGVGVMYAGGAGLLILAVWALLLTLFVVLELTRGLSRGTIRSV
uniref:NADH-ubiquinone oxidoreductase chain 6 n=1 Tax=Parapercis cylindrica TaxID=215381 RepID=A0A1V1FP83_9TELE|nr:NADH dehydrogenase subunit 6 [Parapercis cylindrica]